MGKGIFEGVNGVARKTKSFFIGVDCYSRCSIKLDDVIYTNE